MLATATTADVPINLNMFMKKIKNDEVGIAVALLGFFVAMSGFAIARLWSEEIGIGVMRIGWIVTIVGILINFWIISKKK